MPSRVEEETIGPGLSIQQRGIHDQNERSGRLKLDGPILFHLDSGSGFWPVILSDGAVDRGGHRAGWDGDGRLARTHARAGRGVGEVVAAAGVGGDGGRGHDGGDGGGSGAILQIR